MQFSKGSYTRNFIAFAFLLQNINSAPRKPRLSIADWGQAYHEQGHEGHGTYAFGYEVDDPETGNIQFRDEERHANGSVTGSYGLLEPDGNVRVVHYIADEKGFRVHIVNSEKPNAQFPAPTAPLVAASEGEGQRPGGLPDGEASEQPELETELLDENYDLPPRPSQQPPAESPDEENALGVGDSAVVAAIPDSPPTPPATPPNTIVIPGGFVIEIPPDDPEDDGNFASAYNKVTYDEVSPTAVNTRPPTELVHQTPNNIQYGPVLFHPQTTQQSGHNYYNQPSPTNYYLVPTYSPHYPFLEPTGYYKMY